MNLFLKYNLTNYIVTEIHNLKPCINNNKSIINNLPKNKIPRQVEFTATKNLKKKLYQFSQIIPKEGSIFNSFNETSITLKPKPGKIL
jgi:hypothetical protein